MIELLALWGVVAIASSIGVAWAEYDSRRYRPTWQEEYMSRSLF